MRRGWPNVVAVLERWQRNWRGVGLNFFGGGSCLLWHWYWNRSRMSSSPWLVRRGYGSPIAAIAWSTDCMESSTMYDRTWHLLGKRAPVRYYLTNMLRIGTVSLYETSGGLRTTSWLNLAHFIQCPLVAVYQIAESPLAMSCATAHKLFQKRACL